MLTKKQPKTKMLTEKQPKTKTPTKKQPKTKTLTKKQLPKKLVEKHQRFLTGYNTEFELLNKLLILEEKQEFITHWTEDAELEDDKKKIKAYSTQKKKNEKELSQINKKLEEMKITSSLNPKQRQTFLKNIIDSHKEAISYWAELSK